MLDRRFLLPLLVPLGVAITYGLLASAGLPWPAYDEVWLRDPGATLYLEGRLANPAVTGIFPGIERIYLHYPPAYFSCFAAWCQLFGFGIVQARLFDLAVHLGAMLAVLALARRVAPEAGPLDLAIVLLAYLPYRDQGRVDELAAMFGVLMLLGILGLPARLPVVLAALSAALMGLTSWPMSIAFTVVALGLVSSRVRDGGRPVLLAGLAAGGMAVGLGAVALGPLLWRHWDLLWLQAGADAAASTGLVDFMRIIRWCLGWARTYRYLFPVWAVAVPVSAWVLLSRRGRTGTGPEGRTLWLGGALASVLITILLPNGVHYLRSLSTVLCALLALVLVRLAESPRARAAFRAALLAAALLAQVPLVQNLVVFARVKAEPAYGMEAAADRVRRLIPPGSTVFATRNAYYFTRTVAGRTLALNWAQVPLESADYACIDQHEFATDFPADKRVRFLELFERLEEGPPPLTIRIFGIRLKGDRVPLHAFDVWKRKGP